MTKKTRARGRGGDGRGRGGRGDGGRRERGEGGRRRGEATTQGVGGVESAPGLRAGSGEGERVLERRLVYCTDKT